ESAWGWGPTRSEERHCRDYFFKKPDAVFMASGFFFVKPSALTTIHSFFTIPSRLPFSPVRILGHGDCHTLSSRNRPAGLFETRTSQKSAAAVCSFTRSTPLTKRRSAIHTF